MDEILGTIDEGGQYLLVYFKIILNHQIDMHFNFLS